MIVISNTNPNKNKAITIGICVTLVVLLVICAAVLGYFTFIADDGLILDNVIIADVNIGGKTPEEAKVLVQRQTDLTYPYEDMVVRFPDEDLHLTPANTGVTLDIDQIIADAYKYGRMGTWAENRAVREAAPNTELRLELGDYLSLNTDYIQAQLDAYEAAHTSEYADATVTVEGERPALDAANFDENAACQTIVVYTGNPGRTVDMTGIFERIVEAYGNNEFLVTADVVPTEELPEAVDLEPLYAEHYVEPVDATMDRKTFKVVDESYGYEFDLEAAQALLAEAEYDTTVEIPFTFVKPGMVASDLEGKLFRDTLSSYKTAHSANSNRTHNLKLACAAINGRVLMPGEKLDYNTALGKRTAEKGYKEAIGYTNGASVNQLGGGICQVSSTLYYCTLIADLQIDVRRAHSYVSDYMPLGMDATVSWGGPDFAFTNNTDYPIRIEAWVSGGYVNVKIIGTNTKNYKVKMEYEVLSTSKSQTEYKKMTAAEAKAAGYYDGQVIQTAYDGCSVKTYKCKYDLNTGKLISRTYEATSNYTTRNKIVVDIVETATQPTTPKPMEPAPTEPKPTEPAPTEPTPTEPAPTEPAPTEPTDAQSEDPTEAPTNPPTEVPTEGEG